MVAANPTDKSVALKLKFNATLCGWSTGRVRVSDLWNGLKPEFRNLDDFHSVVLPVVVAPDKTLRGGLTVLLVEAN